MAAVKSRPGFHARCCQPDLLGRRPKDWRSYIEIFAPHIPDSGEVLSIADRYFLSMGAHSTHALLLMDRAAPDALTVQKSIAVSALIGFAIDAPVVPKHSEKHVDYEAPDIQDFQRQLADAGIHSAEDYFNAVSVVAEAGAMFVEMPFPRLSFVTRIIPQPRGKKWPYLSWPSAAATWRALTAYSSGTLSVSIPGRILNFWRAVEAVTTRIERNELFMHLDTTRVLPVWTRLLTHVSGGGMRESRANATRLLKRRAIARRNVLVARHGTAQRALDWLFWERRGKAAHADKSSLDFEGLTLFGEQIADATLFQYMARAAIESKWT